MIDILFYFKEGWLHIISLDALDHQLFILSLCGIYLLKDWKQLLVLVTAFTIGHSLTLAISVYNLIRINSKWVEFLIPCTIILTATLNFFQTDFKKKTLRPNYLLALFFGSIHGLGFANTIRFMLANDQAIGWSLFGFNVGLEVGQIIIVATILLLSFLFVNIFKLKQRWWVVGVSSIALLWALYFSLDRIP